jgi:hypothetical protein
MTINDLIIAVKEKNLSKDQLEDYRDQMSSLFAEIQLEMAELEKQEAVFMEGGYSLIKFPLDKEPSVAQIKIWWKATDKGQRLIVLKRYALALKEMLNSLKSRLYSIY